MGGDMESNVELLLGCFERGVSHRSLQQRSGHSKQQRISSKSGVSSDVGQHSETNSASEELHVRTPQGKEYQIGGGSEHPGGVLALKNLGSAGKQISPGVFYGSPLGKSATKPPPKIQRLLNNLRRDLLKEDEDSSREVEVRGGEFTQATAARSGIWATFPRQEQAILFAENDSSNKLVVFQYQDHINGQRRFLATTYEEFWYRYKGMVADYRHHYEIIQDGKPCHLYFDLEFNRKINAGADGETMVDLLLSVVGSTFLDIYGLQYDPSWTVELDSSTEEKFSRHLIIHARHLAFKNNSHVGAFVGEICKRIHHAKERNGEGMGCLFVKTESRAVHHAELFVDQAVYSRNRSFRLPFSSKAGKRSKLIPTKRFRCTTLDEIKVFMDSLICRVDDKCERLLTFGQEDPGLGGTLDFAAWKEKPSADLRRRLPFCPSGKSPFPALDIFIESVACIGNVPGRIRSWFWFSEYGVVVYNISENRFCERIGRAHKSNGVMYIVDFRTAGYYQKCHDSDCRGYRSPLRSIPRHTIPPEYPLSSAPPSSCLGKQEDGSRSFFGEEWEDEKWWEEVVSSLSSLECASQFQESNQVSSMSSLECASQSQESNQVSSMSSLECASQSQESNQVFQSWGDQEDDWWCAVEQQLVDLEKNSLMSACHSVLSQSPPNVKVES